MSDLENTTISVKTFMRAMWIVITVFAVILSSIAASLLYIGSDWEGVHRDLKDHGGKIDALLAKADKALDNSILLETEVIDLRSQLADERNARKDYRPYKWADTMMKEYGDELDYLNPNLHIVKPDVYKIQADLLPRTP